MNDLKEKKYYDINKDKILQQQKEYRNLNKDKRSNLNKKAYEENKEIVSENGKIRRELIKEENSKLTKEEIYNRTPMKFCKKCDLIHISTEFYIDQTRQDGLERICKKAKKDAKKK